MKKVFELMGGEKCTKADFSPVKIKAPAHEITYYMLKCVTHTEDLEVIERMLKGHAPISPKDQRSMELNHLSSWIVMMLPKTLHRGGRSKAKEILGEICEYGDGKTTEIRSINKIWHPSKPVKSPIAGEAHNWARSHLYKIVAIVAFKRLYPRNTAEYLEAKKKVTELLSKNHWYQDVVGKWLKKKPAKTGVSPKKKKSRKGGENKENETGEFVPALEKRSSSSLVRALSNSNGKHLQKVTSTGYSPEKKKARPVVYEEEEESTEGGERLRKQLF